MALPTIRKTLLPLVWPASLALFATFAAAQSPSNSVLLNSDARGLTQSPAANTPLPSAPAGTAPVATVPAAPVPLTGTVLLPVPTPPSAGGPVVFGSQMFTGRFAATAFSGFNPDYQISVGDRVIVRLWGAVVYEAVQQVDAQGNVFIPNVGPIRVINVRNGELNAQVEQQIKRVFRSNVGVYATLEAAQPVKVFVTGFVKAPGLYAGLSSDAVLYYLDKAGGIDPDRGSYLTVDVMRGGKSRAKVDLYKFLLNGTIDTLQFQDGDTIVVGARRNTVTVAGDALNPYLFEFSKPRIPAAELAALALPRASATHISIVRRVGAERRSEYYPLSEIDKVEINGGDEVTFTSDKFPGTILVRIDGAHQGERTFILPYGAKLQDAIDRLKPAPQANVAGLQLFRLSVAVRQKENLETTIRGLETAALSGRSSTSEEAALRRTEAELILQFVERVRAIVPKGQVVLNNREQAAGMLLEDGDVIRVPEQSTTVSVSGEVMFPNTLVFSPKSDAYQYIELVGGFTQRADRNKLVILKPDGTVAGENVTPQPGDQIMVMPKVETKWVELTRGITSILFQLAITAKALADF